MNFKIWSRGMIESWSSRRLAGDLLRRIPTAAHLLHTVMCKCRNTGSSAVHRCEPAVHTACRSSNPIRTMSLSTCTKLCERRERNDGRRQEWSTHSETSQASKDRCKKPASKRGISHSNALGHSFVGWWWCAGAHHVQHMNVEMSSRKRRMRRVLLHCACGTHSWRA